MTSSNMRSTHVDDIGLKLIVGVIVVVVKKVGVVAVGVVAFNSFDVVVVGVGVMAAV